MEGRERWRAGSGGGQGRKSGEDRTTHDIPMSTDIREGLGRLSRTERAREGRQRVCTITILSTRDQRSAETGERHASKGVAKGGWSERRNVCRQNWRRCAQRRMPQMASAAYTRTAAARARGEKRRERVWRKCGARAREREREIKRSCLHAGHPPLLSPSPPLSPPSAGRRLASPRSTLERLAGARGG